MSAPYVFAKVCPRSPTADALFRRLRTRDWRLALWSLYLGSGVYVPKEAKRTTGASFGYCDADGVQRPKAEATHVGWTMDDPPPEAP